MRSRSSCPRSQPVNEQPMGSQRHTARRASARWASACLALPTPLRVYASRHTRGQALIRSALAAQGDSGEGDGRLPGSHGNLSVASLEDAAGVLEALPAYAEAGG